MCFVLFCFKLKGATSGSPTPTPSKSDMPGLQFCVCYAVTLVSFLDACVC